MPFRIRYYAEFSAISVSLLWGDFFMTNLLTLKAFDFASVFENIISEWYYYLLLLAVLVFILVFFSIKKPKKSNNFSDTQRICYTALFSSLCFVANILTYFITPSSGLSAVITVCFFAGVLLGAKCGFLTGFIGDLLGAIIMPAGAYNPLIGIASGLLGFIPGVIFSYFKGNGILKTVISFVLTLIVCTAGLNTFALFLMYGLGKKTFFAYLIVRLPYQILNMAINLTLSILIYSALKKIQNGKFFSKQ